tara:strand:- start:5075 stop:5860 length:786 start_codon:yes stop_codon:yes gene_type:complete
MKRLDGLSAVVTGGGRGIGRAIALDLAREGANITISSRTGSQLDEVVGEIEATGSTALAVEANALMKDEAISVVSSATTTFGKVDILVNNVGGGTSQRGPEDHDPYTHDDDVFVNDLMLNLVTHYWTTKAALPGMRDRSFGRIINIGSGYAKRSGGTLVYSAAKHGLIGYTRALAAQVALHGITVNCLCPGWTNTQLIGIERRAERFDTDVSGAKALLAEDNLLDRILEPEELGPMAVLLAAPESAGITGQVISVDGGFKV